MYTGGMGGFNNKKFDPSAKTNYDNKEVQVIIIQDANNNFVVDLKRQVRCLYL